MEFTSWDAGLHTGDEEHLEHYGVLGMKWGQRRFQNKDGSLTPRGQKHYAQTGEYGYHYKSHATKKYERKAAKAAKKADHATDKGLSEKTQKKAWKLMDKAEKYANRAKRSSEVDKGEQEYAKSLSTGKAVAGTLLLGGTRMKGYAQYRAMAGQTGKNMTGQKVAAGIKAFRSGSGASRIAKAGYIRQDEGSKSLGAKAYNINKKLTDKYANLQDKIAGAHGGFPDRENKKKRRNG